MSNKVAPASATPRTTPRKALTVSVPDDVKLDPAVEALLASLDVDGDGTVTLPELLAMINEKNKTESENKGLRRMLFGAFVLYVLTLGAIFAVSFAAARLLKDSFNSNGVMTDADGKTISTATENYLGEAALTDLVKADSEVLEGLTSMSFELPSGQAIRFGVAGYLATPGEEEGSDWAGIELFSCTGQSLFINNENATLFIPANDFRGPVMVDLMIEEEESTGRRLQPGGGQGFGNGRSPPFSSMRGGNRPPNHSPQTGNGPSSGGQRGGPGNGNRNGGRRLGSESLFMSEAEAAAVSKARRLGPGPPPPPNGGQRDQAGPPSTNGFAGSQPPQGFPQGPDGGPPRQGFGPPRGNQRGQGFPIQPPFGNGQQGQQGNFGGGGFGNTNGNGWGAFGGGQRGGPGNR